MSKFNEVLDKAKAQLDKLSIDYDADLLEKVAKGLGPSIYKADASMVSVSDKSELETVVKNFVGKKLGVGDLEVASSAIDTVAGKMKDAPRKLRINFYYLLVKELGKEGVY